ncbi:MAG TPA: ATP-binding cassette domain-containing protein [Caulobacteraceae bacterium]|nr:ATP-binding cassette domain-containing protein [Caulobacteraceae bacterium]
MDVPAIALDRIGKSFDGRRTFAVRDVSLDVARGAFLALVGGSGAGKSTLLKTINRLIEPDEGAVSLDGRPVMAGPPALLRRGFGYVFQGVGLFPHMTVAENIAITPRLLGWPQGEIVARVDELLALVGLPAAYGARRPDALSGGQRQRVGIARALAARPPVMLMDEPFGALDPLTRADLGQAYRALHDRLGLTTVMVTHDLQEAVLLADRIAVMKEGRLLGVDTPAALLASDNPDIAALMAAPRRMAERVAARLEGRP